MSFGVFSWGPSVFQLQVHDPLARKTRELTSYRVFGAKVAKGA